MSKNKSSAPDGAPPSSPEPSAGDTLADAARTSAGKGVWMGAAVGIGSAAIVAALLYARKKS
ncbi:Asp/Glu/hydantoin racemase [Sphingobium sp. OAS761]|uniref:hypothetical protein n=1 Tax=Sphingobium sp. OAS761 TaxID=2817901 RepID=UPI0020A0D67F|nr:hypothetical protein [Sphingobium sp. OAS761]MCP1468755.1 Asp/Glu/hydantoin racemase [Sphingobium sp. OAS761]